MNKGQKLDTLGNADYENRRYVSDVAISIACSKAMRERYNNIRARNGMARLVTEVSTGKCALLNDENVVLHVYENDNEANESIIKLFS